MENKLVHCKGFDPELNINSKVLILGTLPPIERDWYYKYDWMFWRIIRKSVNTDYNLTQSSPIDLKKQILLENKIALWDIINSADRVNGSRKDKDIKNRIPNDIKQELEKRKSNISAIIINGYNKKDKNSAFKWFKEFNNDVSDKPIIDKEISEESFYFEWNNIKVYPLRATSAINQLKNSTPIDYEDLWIKTIKKYIK